MKKRKQKTGKSFSLRPNYALIIIYFAVGVFALLDPFRGSFFLNPTIGVVIILAAIPLLIKELIARRSWKSENILRQTILDILMFEQIDAMRNIRYRQSIKLTIDSCEYKKNKFIERFLKVTCEHEYTYRNESLVKKNINISIFNDIFIPANKVQTANPYQRTDFNWVKLLYKSGKEEMYQRKVDSGYFQTLRDGRPHFQKNIFLNVGDEVTLTYSIENAFELFSRLVWNIQELSEDVKIFVKNNSAYDLSKFVLAINHPNREKMHSANEGYLNDKCCLKRGASEGDWDCEILFEHPFLPYQGFELKWDLL